MDETSITCLEAEDMIVAHFCETNGGIEYAMPIIRNAFSKAGANFADPTPQGLEQVVVHLLANIESFKGHEFADKQARFYKKIIRRIK